MIAVVDYGAGNLCSVANTLDALGATYAIVRDAETLSRASKVILPGVGHFGQMMRALDEMELRGALIRSIDSGVPFFGICLGMHALFEGSAEAPEARGLGIFPGRAERFSNGLRVPHMGWNRLHAKPESRLFRGMEQDAWFYFAHSYYVGSTPVSAGDCDYSVRYAAAVERGHIFGVQFHPEKSAQAGQAVVRAFLEL